MNLERMAELKDKLIHGAKFADVMSFFLAHFGNDPAFIRLGALTRHAFLEGVLGEIGRQMFGRPTPPSDLLLTRLPEWHFIHGGCFFNGRVANVLYFEDVAVGLLAVAPFSPAEETRLARFTGKPLAPPRVGRPSVN
jgi:hypothetical protein